MRKNVWGKSYDGLEIRSDYRVHDVIFSMVDKYITNQLNSGKEIAIFDAATGSGALAKRIKDVHPEVKIDINDYERQAGWKGYRDCYSIDLNSDFSEKTHRDKYDIILAAEIMEHLENPWHFLRQIKRVLKEEGVVFVSTPNTDSILDRLWFLMYGHEFYFGENGYKYSVGHISPVPTWKMKLITSKAKLIIDKHEKTVNIWPHIGILTFAKIIFFCGLSYIFSVRKNDVSINIFSLKHSKSDA